MKSIASVLSRIPLFKLYRQFGWPRMLPLNLTISPSPKCNSRCLTCNIWMKREDELTIDEWDKVLSSLGRAPYWFTISGGEPLMYPYVVELAQLVYERCRPGVINIPTNAILPNIPDRVERIATSCPESQLIINLSLDGVGKKHDFIRGIPGNFKKFEERLGQLLALRKQLPNLTIGIHSVISVFSVGHLDELIAYADQSGADQFITEIAEPRVELDTVGLPITPSPETYGKAIDQLTAYVNSKQFKGMAKFTEALRIEYYKLVKQILTAQDQVIACYAGWASAQIYADGTVWPCCVRADQLGNLRQYSYDFKRIWFGDKIREVRRSIAAKECHCPLANASYTNMLHDIPTLARVSAKVLRPSAPRRAWLGGINQNNGTDVHEKGHIGMPGKAAAQDAMQPLAVTLPADGKVGTLISERAAKDVVELECSPMQARSHVATTTTPLQPGIIEASTEVPIIIEASEEKGPNPQPRPPRSLIQMD